jgi:hypothetical protein
MVRIQKLKNNKLNILVPEKEFIEKYKSNFLSIAEFVERKFNIEIDYVDYNISEFVEKNKQLIDFDSEQHNAKQKLLLIDCHYNDFKFPFIIQYPILMSDYATINISKENFDSLFIEKETKGEFMMVVKTKYSGTIVLRGKEKELMSIKRRFDKIYSEILREEYKR